MKFLSVHPRSFFLLPSQEFQISPCGVIHKPLTNKSVLNSNSTASPPHSMLPAAWPLSCWLPILYLGYQVIFGRLINMFAFIPQFLFVLQICSQNLHLTSHALSDLLRATSTFGLAPLPCTWRIPAPILLGKTELPCISALRTCRNVLACHL